MERQVNYPVNRGGNFVIKPPLCSFFRHYRRDQITMTDSATNV